MFDSGSASGLLDSVPDCEQPATLQQHHAHIAREQFREIDAVTTLYLTRCEEDARRGKNEAHQGEFAHVEIAAILHITERAAARMIDLGCDLRLRLHRISAAFASGTLDLIRTRAIADALANVSDDKLADIERRLLEGGERLSTTTLKQRARRLIARLDPDGVHRRRERAEADRDVRTHAADDGMSTVEGLLPTVGAQRLSMRLREMSLQVCAEDPRTHAQRRADALIALADGADHLPCHCRREHCPARSSQPRSDETASDRTGAAGEPSTGAPPRPKATILVGVSATTLLGLDDLPGYLHGYGAIDATLARDIAADGTWKQVLTLTDKDRAHLIANLLDELRTTAPELFYDTTETDGHRVSGRRIDTHPHGPILGVGKALRAAGITPATIRNRTTTSREALTYQPSRRLAEIIRTRDGTCRFPNCTARAQDCDLDHTIPFNHTNPANGGLTIEQNLACLCRKHHRLKTEGYWTVTQLGSGRLQWTDPHGTTTITEPNGAFNGAVDDHANADDLTLRDLAYRNSGHTVEDDLAYRNSGHTVEDDLAYLLDTLAPPNKRHPDPGIPAGRILVIDLDEPPPF